MTHPPRTLRPLLTRALVLASLTCAALAASAACDAGTVPSSVTFAMRGGFPAGGSLTSDTGLVIQLERAELTVEGVELIACPAAPTVQLRELLGTSVARAHTHGSPTHIGEPHVLDLLSPTATTLGMLAPPAGNYCSARISLGPADADAEGLPDLSFVGTMFALGANLTAPAARTVSGTATNSLTTDALFAPALALAEGDDVHIELVFGDETALDGLTLGTQTDDELAERLVVGAQASIQAILTR